MLDHLLRAESRFTASDIAAGLVGLPTSPGVMAWFFTGLSTAAVDGARLSDGICLAFIGSSANLRRRVTRDHLAGNAGSSTLRLSLGCLLAAELSLRLQRRPGSDMCTWGAGEAVLTEWLLRHGRVSWYQHDAPAALGAALLEQQYCPLNLEQRPHTPFKADLSRWRREALARAEC